LDLAWDLENADAILVTWYAGQTAGTALGDVLFGDYSPAGRLPMTWYKTLDQLPDFTDYTMNGL
jgi:beta-glucosidase